MDNQTAILVENLSKRYRMAGGLQGNSEVKSFRDMLAFPYRRFKEIKGLTSFGKNDSNILWAINDVSFSIKKGEVVGIIGKNGAGKSTLLKLLSHITAPTKGRINISGRVNSLLEVGTGFHPELTGRENVYMNGTIHGMTKAEIDSKFDDIVEFSGVSQFIDTPVKRYSSGMQVRLGFSVAAHLEPEILIIDEVLAVGDFSFRKRCLEKIQDVTQAGERTVLIVSHQLGLISELCSRSILMKKGNIEMDGATSSVISKYLSDTDEGFESDTRITFARDPEKQAQLLEAEIVNLQRPEASDFDLFETPRIKLRYVLNQPLEGICISLSVKVSGEVLLVTMDTDKNQKGFDERKAGVYETEIDLPDILKAGRYTVQASMFKPHGHGAGNFDTREVLNFDVHENLTDASLASYSTTRPGKIAANLAWNTNRVEG